MLLKPERSLTVVECILVAAAELDCERSTFSAEDLVVKAWELFPDRFGLQGYSERYPDSNRVLTKIMGASSPLKTKAWIERVGTKRYRLSHVGRLAAEDLSQVGSERRLAALPRPFVLTIRRMLNSTAYAKFLASESPTFSDAAAFWNISARSTANQLSLRLNETESALKTALKTVADAPVTLPGTGQGVNRDELQDLLKLSRELTRTFARELDVIRSRKNERYA
jgi:hypothetical protein